MKSPFVIFRGRSFLDTLGLLALLLLFTANAFHFDIYLTFVFYRELFGVFFTVLSFWYLFTRTRVLRGSGITMNRALFYLLLFPVLLGLWSFFDSGVPLYGDTAVEGTTQQLGGAGFGLYVLRNALIYLPVVVYFYLRGLNKQEIRLIALVAIVVAPFSIGAYLQSGEIATLATLGLVAEMGGEGIAYNSYVPYLTFSVLCGIFLLFSRTSLPLKVVVLLCVAITGIFCLLSTSRQSVLFVVLALGMFIFFARDGRSSKGKWLNLTVITVICIVIFSYFTQGYELSEKFLNRFGLVEGFTIDETSSSRLAAAIDGLLMLNPLEWFTGAGLTSVITSGPHNDYVRWSQRVGIPLMIFGFMPFFIALRSSFRLALLKRLNNSLFVFIAMAVGFTMFHSLFGYPREDANQAVAVYLGLALWFGALRAGLLTSAEFVKKPKQHLCQDSGFVQQVLTIERPPK